MASGYKLTWAQRKKKTRLECDIARVIRAFNRDTGLLVEHIEFDPIGIEDGMDDCKLAYEVRTRVRPE